MGMPGTLKPRAFGALTLGGLKRAVGSLFGCIFLGSCVRFCIFEGLNLSFCRALVGALVPASERCGVLVGALLMIWSTIWSMRFAIYSDANRQRHKNNKRHAVHGVCVVLLPPLRLTSTKLLPPFTNFEYRRYGIYV